jgi:hypothetical protein
MHGCNHYGLTFLSLSSRLRFFDFGSKNADNVDEACWSNAAERVMFPAIACLAVVVQEQGSETRGL